MQMSTNGKCGNEQANVQNRAEYLLVLTALVIYHGGHGGGDQITCSLVPARSFVICLLVCLNEFCLLLLSPESY